MKKEIDQLPLELCEVILAAIRKTPKNVQLYWARNEDVLFQMLNKVKDFEPLTLSDREPYLLPATKETTGTVLWRKGYIETIFLPEFSKAVPEKCLSEPACSVQAHHINVGLRIVEIFEELGVSSIDDLASRAFSYSQIVSFLNCHKDEKEKDNALLYRGHNYFPLLSDNGKVDFVCFYWKDHSRWRGFFMNVDKYFYKGTLLLKKVLS